MSKSVSDVLVGMLAEEGVERMYGIVGDNRNQVVESVHQNGRIRWVNVRHEETAAFAASAEAQLTGGISACCGSCGPGNLHLLNGLYDAHRSRVPVFALAPHIPLSVIGSQYFQETHPEKIFSECTSYCELLGAPEQTYSVVGGALRTADSQQDVGMVVLPSDVAAESVDNGDQLFSVHHPQSAAIEPDQADVEALAELINTSRRVVFFCGIGCSRAAAEIVQLAKLVAAPIVYTLRAKDILEKDNPYAIGMTGMLGWGDATYAMHEADLLVMWGTDFPYSSFLPMHGRVAQVDIDTAALGRRIPLHLAVHGDVGCTIRRMLPLIIPDRADDFLARSLSRHGKAVGLIQAYVREVDTSAPLRPEYMTKLISDQAEPDAIFTVDSGTPIIWAARYLQALGTRRIIGSFNHGSMACALAMAIGAKAAFPSRQVIALCGEDGLGMLSGDILTLLQEKLSVKIFVYNNSVLDFVALDRPADSIRSHGTNIRPTNYASMARSMGISGIHLEHADDASYAVRQWLSEQGAALLDAAIDPHALALPPDITMLKALGFAGRLTRSALRGELDCVKRILFDNRKLFY